MAKIVNIYSDPRSYSSFDHSDTKCHKALLSEIFFDAISECPHVNVEEVEDGSISTVPQIVEPQELNSVTLTVPITVLATHR